MARQYYKDSTTGQMKPLGVKVEDTLPVGTEVDYDGTDIPEGWEEVDDSWTDDASGNFSYKKIGEIRYIRLNDPQITTTANTWYELGTLSTEYRPVATLYLTGANNGYSTSYITRITTAGKVSIYPLTSETINVNGLLSYIK